MGADLYIEKLSKPCRAKYEPLFHKACKKRDEYSQKHPDIKGCGWDGSSSGDAEYDRLQAEVTKYFDLLNSEGYFRDSYNGTSVLWTLDLSWWTDVIPLLNKRGNLSGVNLRKFLKMLESAEQKLPSADDLKEKGCAIDGGENNLESWHIYYKEKRQRLIDFVKTAIKMRTCISCSL